MEKALGFMLTDEEILSFLNDNPDYRHELSVQITRKKGPDLVRKFQQIASTLNQELGNNSNHLLSPFSEARDTVRALVVDLQQTWKELDGLWKG